LKLFLKPTITALFFTALIFFIPLFVPSLCKADTKKVDVSLRLTYDRLELPKNETMGLLGSSFLIDKKLNTSLRFYSGISVYSAVTGIRGGFFTGGIAVGLKTRFESWILDTGFFIGGGGGGAAPQGGGLMLRPHLAVLHNFQTFRLGLFFSKTNFPNGNIDSSQFGLQIERPFQMVLADSLETELSHLDLILKRVTIAPTLQFYQPKTSAKARNGLSTQSKMALIGIETGIDFHDNLLLYAEAAGAFKGDADGFAELLVGIAYDYPRKVLGVPISLRLKGAIGSAGGGNVDTAGGIIYKITSSISFAPSEHLKLNLDYGIVDAPRGSFQAQMFKTSIAYQIDTAFPGLPDEKRQKSSLNPKNLKLGKWAVRTSLSRYLPSNRLRKSRSRDEVAVDLFQLKFDRALSAQIYFTGQAGGAFNGDTGGYATGLFGLGFKKEITRRIVVLAELLAGAGGGGGIASNGGSIIQAMLGITYRISRHFGLQVLVGQIKALKGELDAKVIDIGLVLPFSTIESKPATS